MAAFVSCRRFHGPPRQPKQQEQQQPKQEEEAAPAQGAEEEEQPQPQPQQEEAGAGASWEDDVPDDWEEGARVEAIAVRLSMCACVASWGLSVRA